MTNISSKINKRPVFNKDVSWEENYQKKIRMSWTTIREGRVYSPTWKKLAKNGSKWSKKPKIANFNNF